MPTRAEFISDHPQVMARKKATVRRTKKAKTPRMAKAITSYRAGLDRAAIDYARVLRDPCNAPLTRSLAGNSSGSLISRFEQDFIFKANANSTAAVLAFFPGLNQTVSNSADWPTDLTFSILSFSGLGPGNTFLQQNAASVRCVAACLQVTFPGTELNRSGVIGLGVVEGGLIQQVTDAAQGGSGGTICAAYARQACQHTERMPQNMAEITWFPGSQDEIATYTSNATNVAISNVGPFQGRNALLMSASGFPVNVGVRVRMVAVYEWTPLSNKGMINTLEPSTSRNNVQDVLSYLHKQDSSWYINAWKKTQSVMHTVGNVIDYGGKILGAFM